MRTVHSEKFSHTLPTADNLRLSGSADVDLESNGEAITPLLSVLGLDAEWQPNTSQGMALFQMAFRRSVLLNL